MSERTGFPIPSLPIPIPGACDTESSEEVVTPPRRMPQRQTDVRVASVAWKPLSAPAECGKRYWVKTQEEILRRDGLDRSPLPFRKSQVILVNNGDSTEEKE